MMKRRVYYDILLVGFSLVFVYHVFRLLMGQFAGIFLPATYTAWLSYLLLYLIIFYEIFQSEKTIKSICIGLVPVVVIGKLMIVMHWPFGFLIFLLSASLIWFMLLINAYRSRQDLPLKILILLYPLNRVILYRLFFFHSQPSWWLIDFSLFGLIAITIAIIRIKSGYKPSDQIK